MTQPDLKRTEGRQIGIVDIADLASKIRHQGVVKRVSFALLQSFYSLYGLFKRARTKLRGQRFTCAVLGNIRDISNVIVNSDGTITCSDDMTGESQLGNILKDSFEAIYHNEKSASFRRALTQGQFPIRRCVTCKALTETGRRNRDEAGRQPGAKPVIHSLSIETTVICNYNCGGCMRDLVYASRKKTTLNLDEIKLILKRFENYDVRRVWLFNRGEPVLARNFPEHLRLIKDIFPKSDIYFSTNGFYIDNDRVRSAIVECVTAMEISIDGVDQSTAERYQVGVDYARVTKNLKDMVDYRNRQNSTKPGIFWKYVLFNWNDRLTQLENLKAQAKNIGVDGIMFIAAKTPFYAMPYHFLARQKKYFRQLKLSKTLSKEILLSFSEPVLHPYGGNTPF